MGASVICTMATHPLSASPASVPVGYVGVGVATAVLQAQPTEAAVTAGARQRQAAVEVHERLAASVLRPFVPAPPPPPNDRVLTHPLT